MVAVIKQEKEDPSSLINVVNDEDNREGRGESSSLVTTIKDIEDKKKRRGSSFVNPLSFASLVEAIKELDKKEGLKHPPSSFAVIEEGERICLP